MYLIVGVLFLGVMVVRFGLSLLGYKLKPWLPPSGRKRYYADMVMTAPILLCFAVGFGFEPSFKVAFAIVVVSTLIASGLDAIRKGRLHSNG